MGAPQKEKNPEALGTFPVCPLVKTALTCLLNVCYPAVRCVESCLQGRNDGVAAASSDGGPTGGRGPRLF